MEGLHTTVYNIMYLVHKNVIPNLQCNDYTGSQTFFRNLRKREVINS